MEVVLKDETSIEKTTQVATRLQQLGETRIVDGEVHAQRQAGWEGMCGNGKRMRERVGCGLGACYLVQAADRALRVAKEEQRANLVPAKRAADVASELLALRGKGGSAKSRAVAAGILSVNVVL